VLYYIMLTIITPCCRQNNIPKLFNSINFNKIINWIIIYDTSNDRKYNKLYENNPKIMEVECTGGISGNPQRNHGISLVNDGYIYFLDDDNIIHPEFWSIVDKLDNNNFYTFDQARTKGGKILRGNEIGIRRIDTAMFIVHKKHIGNITWKCDLYGADFFFISEININNAGKHTYINKTACYYNYLK
jgi:hypothetical protein